MTQRPTAVAAFEADSYRTKLIAIADAQREGRLDPSFTRADLLALALGFGWRLTCQRGNGVSSGDG